jgi:outer membrane protein
MQIRFGHALFSVTVAVLPGMSWAQETEPVSPPLWEVGVYAFGVSQQAYPGAVERVNRVLLLPRFRYRGEYVRIEGGSAGLRAVKTPTFEVDIGFAGALGSGSDDIAIRRDMPKLGTMIEFGPRLRWNLARWPEGMRLRADLPLRGVYDISHQFSNKGVAFEPELRWEKQSVDSWSYSAGIGALYGNRKLNDTYFGVAPEFARPGRPAYAADSGLVTLRLSAGASRWLSQDWLLFGFAHIDSMRASANRDSPLVTKQTGASIGFGVKYTWLRSEKHVSE